MRFPFTFMGIVSIGLGIFVLVYLGGQHRLDPLATALAVGAAIVAFAFGGYVLVRRALKGGQA